MATRSGTSFGGNLDRRWQHARRPPSSSSSEPAAAHQQTQLPLQPPPPPPAPSAMYYSSSSSSHASTPSPSASPPHRAARTAVSFVGGAQEAQQYQQHAPPAPSATVAAAAKRRTKSSKSQESSSSSSSGRKLQFINASDPNHNRDPSVRMLVRSHVMKGVKREEKLARTAKKQQKAANTTQEKQQQQQQPRTIIVHADSTSSPPPIPLSNPCNGSTMSLYGATPISARPESHKLLNYYRQVIGNAVYPFPEKLTYNPLDLSWIPCALSDEIFFKTLMFSSASHLAFSTGGSRVANLPTVILQSVFSQLGQRLNGMRNLSDATIGAVTCLAMVENMRGNFTNFSLHMQGLRNILDERQMDDIEPQMRLKVYRTEVEGAVNFLSRPVLPPYARHHAPLETILPAECVRELGTDDLSLRLMSMGLSAQLTDCFCGAARFSRSLDYVLKNPSVRMVPTSYEEDIICIQLQFLGVAVEDEAGINRAARIGGMLFAKSTFRSMGIAPPSSKLLIGSLKDALVVLRPDPAAAPLILWLVFVGCVCSLGLPEHAWFFERLTSITMHIPGYQSWEQCLQCLSSILWVDSIHRGPCKSTWADVWSSQAEEFLLTN